MILPALALALLASADFTTPAEASHYQTTPRTAETLAYLHRLADAAPQQVRIETFGKSAEGRDLVAVLVSADGVFDPARIHAAGRPVLLVQNAIHAGEMDGKDASLALLRDLLVTKTVPLGRTVLVIVPIYNADGHERVSAYNRINQNGPREMGFRTNGRNLNLNRDYVKADAPETRAFLKLWNRWLPDLFIDNHVTDGADYQADVTWELDDGPVMPPALVKWQDDVLAKALTAAVKRAGHLAVPYIAPADDTDLRKGLVRFQLPPRFSTGYTTVQNRPGLLIEMHMLKDYKTRVVGNHAALVGVLEALETGGAQLVRLNREADAVKLAGTKLPLQFEPAGDKKVALAGKAYRRTLSEISGAMRVEYLPENQNVEVSAPASWKVTDETTLPQAYLVPAQWTEVIDVLAAHGLKLRRTRAPFRAELPTVRCDDVEWQAHPFEGRHVLFSGENNGGRPGHLGPCTKLTATLEFPTGSVLVPLDQRAGKVAAFFLEPQSPDSAMRWGFFDPIFEQKEFGEAYVVEALARDMLSKNPKLRDEFEAKLESDKEFAASPARRLDFFYQRSPWHDARVGVYPVGRLDADQVARLPLQGD